MVKEIILPFFSFIVYVSQLLTADLFFIGFAVDITFLTSHTR